MTDSLAIRQRFEADGRSGTNAAVGCSPRARHAPAGGAARRRYRGHGPGSQHDQSLDEGTQRPAACSRPGSSTSWRPMILRLNLAVLAIALAQEQGGRRIAVQDASIHSPFQSWPPDEVNRWSLFRHGSEVRLTRSRPVLHRRIGVILFRSDSGSERATMDDVVIRLVDEQVPRDRLAVLLKHFSKLSDERELWRVMYPLVPASVGCAISSAASIRSCSGAVSRVGLRRCGRIATISSPSTARPRGGPTTNARG